MGEASDIDRLIELGLSRYGAGDLDGALLMWEEALAIDPDNAQANSYVDYVRLNYELLSGEPSVDESADTKFAIEEDPEYQIEIIPMRPSEPGLSAVELPPAAEMISLDPVDVGWDFEEGAVAGAEADAHANRTPLDAETLELELSESPPRDPVNFEDATREFHGVAQKISRRPAEPANRDFNTDDHSGGFNNPQATPVGFAMQETEIRKRELGFVKPTAPTTRSDDLELGHYEATQERASRYGATEDADEQTDDDLIDSLPTPRPANELESGEILLPKNPTRELPEVSRQPAQRLDSSAISQAEVMLPHAPTQELTPNEIRGRASDPGLAHTTRALSHELRARSLEPILSAPTRELGLRPNKLTNPDDDDDAPTGQTDARAIRAAAARDDGRASRAEGTSHDIVLPFDPVAAQAAQILDDVDEGAPAGEPADERTRRRITRLLELAGDWNDTGDLDKAVSAVDLALSEDPNSALGQKLITRNKDTIMSLFQHYLGDLERMPQLARPLHELANAPISPRAAFLLSRIDGGLTIDELLDVSGMPRLEAYRHLCQLFLRGILR